MHNLLTLALQIFSTQDVNVKKKTAKICICMSSLYNYTG